MRTGAAWIDTWATLCAGRRLSAALHMHAAALGSRFLVCAVICVTSWSKHTSNSPTFNDAAWPLALQGALAVRDYVQAACFVHPRMAEHTSVQTQLLPPDTPSLHFFRCRGQGESLMPTAWAPPTRAARIPTATLPQPLPPWRCRHGALPLLMLPRPSHPLAAARTTMSWTALMQPCDIMTATAAGFAQTTGTWVLAATTTTTAQ